MKDVRIVWDGAFCVFAFLSAGEGFAAVKKSPASHLPDVPVRCWSHTCSPSSNSSSARHALAEKGSPVC